ncbi:MAG TPA: tetratricopeptide repeat protein [Anaerolineales bacterium]|nr:tetratricopeptide repeat protein [Anaerolineales bacterium]
MNVSPRRPLFNRKPQSNIYRMFLWVVMILGGVWMLQQMDKGEIRPLFEPTATPTRAPESYILEGDASFSAGKVDAAIIAYREALKIDPNNAEIWAKLARIQTYSSAFLITNADIKARLSEALASANKAVELAPDDSTAHAVRALTLDWNANSDFHTTEEVQDFLAQAEQEALTAQKLDSKNPLALAYYAEILVDQQQWNRAVLIMNQVFELPDAAQWMDVYRVNAYVLETMGDYNLAISEYEKAINLEPNFTFLYQRIGANYRRLAYDVAITRGEEAARPVYEQSLEYFDKAVKINEQIEVKDPGPHLSIARTYSQLGEFFIAARNVQTALEYEPTNADIYGELGVIYFKSRNYEGSIYSLKCAIYGCSGEDSCLGRGLERCFPDLGENPVDVQGLPISPSTIVYYYIYGSVQAALSRPKDNHCSESMQTMSEVRAELDNNSDDYTDGRETIISIVEAAEEICASLASGTPLPQLAAPTGTATEASGGMDDITATPNP